MENNKEDIEKLTQKILDFGVILESTASFKLNGENVYPHIVGIRDEYFKHFNMKITRNENTIPSKEE